MSSTKDVVSIKIPEKELAEMQKLVADLQAKLAPYVIALSPEQRRTLPKMSDKTMPFVDKASEYVQKNPELAPGYLNVAEFAVDYKAVSDLSAVCKPLTQICQNLEDSIMLSGSEAYQAALTYYNSVQQAAKMNIPNAKAIAEDLGKRFVKASVKPTPTTP